MRPTPTGGSPRPAPSSGARGRQCVEATPTRRPEHPITTAIDNPIPDRDADAAVDDAQLFGARDRAGGWGPALLVARSVHADDSLGGRLTVERFAELSGVDAERVERHYRAWQEAADAGIVPASAALTRDEDPSLPPPEWWPGFFQVAEEPAAAPEPAVEAEPAEPPAVQQNVLEQLAQDPELVREVAATPELRDAINAEATRNNRVGFVQSIADNPTWQLAKKHEITIPAQVREAATEQFAIASAPDATTDDVNGAFKTVRGLLAETIEADPAIHAYQQREKLRRALKTATTRIERLPADADRPIIDDELRGDIRNLLDKLSAIVDPRDD